MKALYILLMIFLSGSVVALEVTTLDNTGFQTDIFNVGDQVTVLALIDIDTKTKIIVTDSLNLKISDKMHKLTKGMYQFDFIVKESGKYQIEITSGKTTKQLEVDVN